MSESKVQTRHSQGDLGEFSPRKFAMAMWDAGMSAKDLSDEMGCSPDAIGRWMAGIAKPRPGYAKGAADIIGVPVSTFYDD